MPEWGVTWVAAAVGCLAAATGFWLWSLQSRDAGVADVGWGLYFVALVLWFRFRGPAVQEIHLLHLAMVALWGTRLAIHLGVRRRGRSEDRRYAAMRETHGAAFGRVSLLTVFWLQALLALLLSAPLYAVQSATTVAWPWAVAGGLLWMTGFVFEAIADEQLRCFRAAPGSADQVLDRGLWRYSRHPNYFGEALLWWGYGALAVGAGATWTLVAPAAMTWLLLRVSGVVLLEKAISRRRPAYQRYVRRTSAFLPWPPRDRSLRGRPST